jgi:hypothetical protein
MFRNNFSENAFILKISYWPSIKPFSGSMKILIKSQNRSYPGDSEPIRPFEASSEVVLKG